ncbi:MAG: response regulator [Deltaproteobacteria bacterium]|nr:response regulator [Deltaproteobacteria bacterium]
MSAATSETGQNGSSSPATDAGQTSQALWSHLRHELRTPLNAIIGYSEMLLEDADADSPADFADDLNQVLSAGRQLLAVVNDLLDAQKLASDDVAFNLESLIANLDYQARTPLNGIIGYSEILLENAAEEGREELVADLRKIHDAGKLFLGRLHNIIDVPGPNAGPKPATIKASDQSPLIASVMTSLRELAQESAAASGGETGALLVVDDNEINRDLLSRYLSRLGHKVQAAPDGRQALEMIGTGAFDLVLLDIMMPELNGYQVLQHLNDSPAWRDLPVIMISALDEMDSVVRCIELGAADYLSKPFNPVLLRARVGACLEKKRLQDLEKEQKRQLQELNAALEVRNRFIRQIFGRYLSDDIVETILEHPGGLKIGGEKRQATILMSDLRGFTAISERLPAEDVVSMVNIYLETMTDIILKYQGTIDEFIGDGILVIFGAPLQRADDAQRAVACAVEMQLAMASVNDRNRQAGYPEVALGIGVNTGNMVVGNIGSKKRTKYGVVGSNVNLTARIESYTVGGQILVSETTLKACSDIVRLDNVVQVSPKGVKEPLTIYEVGGIAGDYQLFLPPKPDVEWIEITHQLPVQFTVLEGKHVGELRYNAAITKLAPKLAEITANILPAHLSNLRLSLYDYQERLITDNLYAKVLAHRSDLPPVFQVNFTALPPEAENFLRELLNPTITS